MADNTGLRRMDDDPTAMIPGFEQLPVEKQQELRAKHAERMAGIAADTAEKVRDSRIAEHDMHVATEMINQLDHDRKIYATTIKVKTGSGTNETTIRGGDIRFIVPIIVAIGFVILMLVLLLRH